MINTNPAERPGVLRDYDVSSLIAETQKNILYFAKKNHNFYTIKISKAKNNLSYIKEYNNIRYLRGHLDKDLRNMLPANIRLRTVGRVRFLTYNYITGDASGNFIKDIGYRFGTFKPNTFNDFVKLLASISELKPSTKVIKSRWSEEIAIKEYYKYRDFLKHKGIDLKYFELDEFVVTNIKKVFSKNVLVLKDLYPENLIKSEKGKIKLIDFEYLSYAPIGYVTAFLYFNLWKEDFWKYKIYSYFYNHYTRKKLGFSKAEYNMSFSVCAVILGMRFIYQFLKYSEPDVKEYEYAINNIAYDINRAINGEIYKVRNVKYVITLNDILRTAVKYGITNTGKIKYKIFFASHGNTVILVNVKKVRYIFRYYSASRSAALINKEIRIYNHLNKNNYPTCKVLPTITNKLKLKINLYNRKRYVVVLSYLYGIKVNKKFNDSRLSRNLGKSLRRMHDLDVTHGDFSKENIVFRGHNIVGVFDFEWGRMTKNKNAKLKDLSRAIVLWVTDVRNKSGDDVEFIKSFVEGYSGGRVERNIMKLLVKYMVKDVENLRSIYDKDPLNPHLRFINALKRIEDFSKNI